MIDTQQLETLNGLRAAVEAGISAGKCYYSVHAEERTAERGISVDDVVDAIKYGHCEFQCTGRLAYASKYGQVILQVSPHGSVCIVTVIEPKPKSKRYVSPAQRKRPEFSPKSTKYLRAYEEVTLDY